MDPYSSMVQLKLTLIENVICWERNSKRKKIFQLDIAKLLSSPTPSKPSLKTAHTNKDYPLQPLTRYDTIFT